MQEVAISEAREVTITNEQKELIRKTICKDATDAEMQLFFFDCQRRGTHPLDKLIHFTKRDGKYTPVTSIDFFRLRAHSSGAYAGEGATTYELGEDGYPNACTVAVLRLVQGQLCTWRATARWGEYYPGEKSGFMWKKMPFLMLAKCAEALALRKAFPAELQGLYVKEEMDQAGPGLVRKFSEMLQESEQPAPAETGIHTYARLSHADGWRVCRGAAKGADTGPVWGASCRRSHASIKDAGSCLGDGQGDGGTTKDLHTNPLSATSNQDAPALSTDDPSAPYRATILHAKTAQEATHAYNATPEALRQEVWKDFQEALKGFSKKK